MSQQPSEREPHKKQQTNQSVEEDYTDAQRRTNEVASTAYTGSAKKKVDLQNDRLETGGF